MLSPAQRAAAIKWLTNERLDYDPSSKVYGHLTEMITALTNGLGLAEQVRVLREALNVVRDLIETTSGIRTMAGSSPRWEEWDGLGKIRSALALDIPEAARQAAENAERAQLLEWWFDETNEGKREEIRGLRSICEIPWTVEEWIARVRSAKEAGNG
jgi:phage tail protein X